MGFDILTGEPFEQFFAHHMLRKMTVEMGFL